MRIFFSLTYERFREDLILKIARLIILCTAVLLGIIITPLVFSSLTPSRFNVTAQSNPSSKISIGFVSDFSTPDNKEIQSQINLDPLFIVTALSAANLNATFLSSIQVLFLFSGNLSAPEINLCYNYVSSGGSLVLFSGYSPTQEQTTMLGLDLIRCIQFCKSSSIRCSASSHEYN